MESDKEKLVNWLTDAYSMEQSLVPILENHVKDMENNNDIKVRIEQHINETKKHMDIVRTCLERYDKSPSGFKTTMGKATSFFQNAMTGSSKDEIVKDAISDFATENFEIASYKALITAAANVGDQETVAACESILRDEEDMANFLNSHLKEIVNVYIMQPHEQ